MPWVGWRRKAIERNMKPAVLCLCTVLVALLPLGAPAEKPTRPEDLPGPAPADTPVATLLQDASQLKWRRTVAAFRRLALLDGVPPEAFRIARERVRDERWMSRLAALEFLSEKSDVCDEFIQILQAGLADESQFVEMQAAQAIGLLRIDAPNVRRRLAAISAARGKDRLGHTARWALEQLDPPPPAAGPTAGTVPVAYSDPTFSICRTESVPPRLADEMLAVLEPAIRRILADLSPRDEWTEPLTIVFYADPVTDRPLLPAPLAHFLPATNSIHGAWLDRDKILLMNPGWGAGILVHELVHARLAFDMEQDPRAGGRNVLPAWAGEALAASYEGNIRTLTNVNGKAFMAFDSRHQSLVAALHRLENPNAEPTAEEKCLLPPTIPPLTLDWLFGLNNDEFLHFYHDTHGGPSIALGREWALYLRERDAVRPWLDALRDGLLRRRTFTVQAWIARDLAWTAAAAALPGKTRDQIESDFRAWVLNRTISDEGHLAGIQKSLWLDPFLPPAAADPAPEKGPSSAEDGPVRDASAAP